MPVEGTHAPPMKILSLTSIWVPPPRATELTLPSCLDQARGPQIEPGGLEPDEGRGHGSGAMRLLGADAGPVPCALVALTVKS
jgi:hypothetical protein